MLAALSDLLGSRGKKPHDATMRGIELLGREVIPALREHRSALVTGNEVTSWPQ
jgi:hypothetical protein